MISLWKHELNHQPKLTPRQIVAGVAMRHGLTVDDLLGQSRRREIAWPRQEAMAAVYARCNVSMPWVGRYFNRDHTTVLHAIRRVEERGRAH